MPGMKGTMKEFAEHTLHSGKGGPVVTDRKQAIAIGLAQQARGRARGGAVPPMPVGPALAPSPFPPAEGSPAEEAMDRRQARRARMKPAAFERSPLDVEPPSKRAGMKRRGYAMGGRVIEAGERAAGIQRVADDD